MKLFTKITILVTIIAAGILVAKVNAATLSTDSTKTVPQFSHIAVVVLENHSYNQVVGNKSMPYYNSLIKKYSVAQKYFANTHPSIGNYFMLTTGKIITNNDNFSGTTSEDNIAKEINLVGKKWRVYAEGLPKIGYFGESKRLYLKRHNPFAYFKDVRNDINKNNLVPFTNFSKDSLENKLPDFSFIIPDACNDAHDCSLKTADNWLKKNLDPLINSTTFKNDGLLVIVFDEGKASDKAHGGGQDPVVFVGSKVKNGFQSTIFYQHQNLLKTILLGLGIQKFPGAAQSAIPMLDFFK